MPPPRRARFIGTYDTVPESPDSKMLVFQRDYGLVTTDDHLVIMVAGRSKHNGASIPRFAWPLVGHPLTPKNRRWSSHHDGGYNGTAVVIDLDAIEPGISPEFVFEHWRFFYAAYSVHDRPREWWDAVMHDAMEAVGVNEFKSTVCYRMVRWFGGWIWKRGGEH